MKETVEIYKGYVIRSYIVGRYVAKRAYRCGKERAPTKKLVKKAIDFYLSEPKRYDNELHSGFMEKEE